MGEYKAALKKAEALIEAKVKEISCAPILVRLAWHDSGTFDKAHAGKPWPEAGGAIGSIRTDHEINAPANAGLKKALTMYLQPIKDACPTLSWADLIQLASATAIKVAGGPKIPMKYGRVDGEPQMKQEPNFGLPDALSPFGGPLANKEDPAEHLRYVFYKYGMDDKDIVALSGAHTIGRAFADRSGTVAEGEGPEAGTVYTKKGCPFADMHKADAGCIAFPTDKVLMSDPGFKPHFEAFAVDQKAFFEAYKVSHKKLSELGSKFEPPEGITLDDTIPSKL